MSCSRLLAPHGRLGVHASRLPGCWPRVRRADHESLALAAVAAPIAYEKPDGLTTFDVATSLYRSGDDARALAAGGRTCLREKNFFLLVYIMIV